MEAPLFIKLDTNWPDNPKVIAAGLDGAGLHASIMCTVKRLETDGVLTTGQVMRLGGTPELIDRLLRVGLLDRVDDDRVAVHGWLDTNRSSAAIQAERRAKRASGMRGNHKRWRHPGPVEKCPMCMAGGSHDPSQNPAELSHNGRSSQGATPTDSHPSRTPESGATPTESPETETETETDTFTRGDGYLRGRVETVPPHRCKRHAKLPDDADIPPCGACADARRRHDAWRANRPAPPTDRHDHRLDAQQQALLEQAQANMAKLRSEPKPVAPVERKAEVVGGARAALRTRQAAAAPYDEAPF